MPSVVFLLFLGLPLPTSCAFNKQKMLLTFIALAMGAWSHFAQLHRELKLPVSSYFLPSRWPLWPLTNDYRVRNMKVSFLPQIEQLQDIYIPELPFKKWLTFLESLSLQSLWLACNHTLVCFFFSLLCPVLLMPLPVSPKSISLIKDLPVLTIPKVGFWGMKSKQMLEVHSQSLLDFKKANKIEMKGKSHVVIRYNFHNQKTASYLVGNRKATC